MNWLQAITDIFTGLGQVGQGLVAILAELFNLLFGWVVTLFPPVV